MAQDKGLSLLEIAIIIVVICLIAFVVSKRNNKEDVTPEIVRFTVEPEVIRTGEVAELYWWVNDSESCRIYPEIGAVSTSGRQIVTPKKTTSYTLTVTGIGGNSKGTVTVRVADPPPPEYEEFNEKWAILIGVENYDDKRISRAKYATEDSKKLAHSLKKNCGFKVGVYGLSWRMVPSAEGKPGCVYQTKSKDGEWNHKGTVV